MSVTKRAFSLIELLVVLTLVAAVGGLCAMKGAQFVRNFQQRQEIASLTHFLSETYLYSQLQMTPVTIDIDSSSGPLKLRVDKLKLSKKFDKLTSFPQQGTLVFYPHLKPNLNKLVISNLDGSLKLQYNKEKFLF